MVALQAAISWPIRRGETLENRREERMGQEITEKGAHTHAQKLPVI